MDQDKKERQIQRGLQAERLLGDPLLQEGFTALQAKYLEEWTNTGPTDTEKREALWRALKVMPEVRNHLQKVLNDGKMAKRDIDALVPKLKAVA